MRAELEIFSGRPNPVWSLTPDGAAELRAMAGALPPAVRPPRPPDGLGYRGISVRDPATPGWSLLTYRDIVWVGGTSAAEARSDPRLTVEQWLLDSAGDLLDPAMRARIRP